MRTTHNRIVDYSIYIGCGLALSLALFGPLVWGIDDDWYLPRATATLVAIAVVGVIAYELRAWRKRATFWLFLLAIGIFNVLGTLQLQAHRIPMNGAVCSAATFLQLYLSRFLFRDLSKRVSLGQK